MGTRGCPGGGAEVKPGHSATGSDFYSVVVYVIQSIVLVCPRGCGPAGRGMSVRMPAPVRGGGNHAGGHRTACGRCIRSKFELPDRCRSTYGVSFFASYRRRPAARRLTTILRILYSLVFATIPPFHALAGAGWRVRGRGVRTQCAPRSTGARTCTPDNLTITARAGPGPRARRGRYRAPGRGRSVERR